MCNVCSVGMQGDGWVDQHFVCDGNHFLVMHHQVDIDSDIWIIWENVFNNFRNCYPEQNVQTIWFWYISEPFTCYNSQYN